MANPSAEMPVLAALAALWAFFGCAGGKRRWALLAMLVLSMGIGGSDGLDNLAPPDVVRDRSGNGRSWLGYRQVAMALAWPTPSAPQSSGVVGVSADPSPRTLSVQPATPLVPMVPSVAQGWRSLVCAAPFTWPCEWALAVIACESGGNPNAYNPAGPYVGGFQVLNGPTDPYLNAVEAHIQFAQYVRGERPNPWPNCP